MLNLSDNTSIPGDNWWLDKIQNFLHNERRKLRKPPAADPAPQACEPAEALASVQPEAQDPTPGETVPPSARQVLVSQQEKPPPIQAATTATRPTAKKGRGKIHFTDDVQIPLQFLSAVVQQSTNFQM